MKLVFSPSATPEQRATVAAALERRGVHASEVEGSLLLDGALTRDAAVEVAAFPGVAEVLPTEGGQATVHEAVLDWVAGATAILGVLVLLTSHFPAPLGQPADPLRTPGDLRPSWPLLAWYAAVDRAPAWLPVPLLLAVAAVLLLAWPWLGRRFAERAPVLHAALGVAVLLAVAALAALEVAR